MKILRITSSGFEEGGVENAIVLLQSVFEKRGHVVKTLASDTRPELPHFSHYTFKNINHSKLSQLIYTTFNPYSYFALKKALKEFQPDVVDLYTMAQVSPSVLFLLHDYPTVLTIHGPEIFTKSLLPWYLRITDFKKGEYNVKDLRFVGTLKYLYFRYVTASLYRLLLSNVDVIITLSTYMQRLMAQDGLQTTLVPNAAALLEYKPLKKEALTHTLVYAGRLEKFKGVDYLIYALSEVIHTFPDTHLFIAGDGTDKSNLERLSKDLDLQKSITFLGHLKRTELEKFYQRASLVVMPSTWPEAFGKIGVEAMSVGRPVVATNVGGISDWLADGKTGSLVPPKDSQALSNAVIKLFSDPGMLIHMSEECRKKSEEFSLEKHVDRMEKIYKDFVEKYQKCKRV